MSNHEGADFTAANLRGVDFRGASLLGTTFCRVLPSGESLLGSGAVLDSDTRFDLRALDDLSPLQAEFVVKSQATIEGEP